MNVYNNTLFILQAVFHILKYIDKVIYIPAKDDLAIYSKLPAVDYAVLLFICCRPVLGNGIDDVNDHIIR